LKLPDGALSEVLSIIADMQSGDEERKKKDRERKRKIHGNAEEILRNENGNSEGQSDEPRAVIPPAHIHASAPVCSNGSSLRSEPSREDTPLPSVGPQVEKTEKKSTGRTLPKDWVPSESLFAYGRQQSLTDGQTAEILENMRLWAHSNANRAIARKADWDGTMQGAIRRDAAKFKARASPQRSNGRGGAAHMLEDLLEKRNVERKQEIIPAEAPKQLSLVSGERSNLSRDIDGLISGSFKQIPGSDS
jgi:hypothetical protein